MRIAVYNHFWATAGGGEAEALVLAEALTKFGRVELWTPPGVNFDALGQQFGVDVGDLEPRLVDFDGFVTASALTAEYDLFVNLTHAAEVISIARFGLMFVHFPLEPGRHLRPIARRVTNWLAQPAALGYVHPLRWRRGVHGEEPGNPPSRWTEGEAVLLAWVPPGRARALRLGFGHDHPGDIETTILVNGVEVQQVVVGTTDVATSIPLRGRRDGWPVEVRVLSPTFRPADLWGSADQRELGVQVVDARLGRFPAPEPLTKLQPVHLARDFIWVDSYDRVIVNSDYCRQWTWNVWHRQPDVVSPPVLLRHPGPKRNIILSVGRFFASQRGHSKRQLDMVRAFRDLVAGGLTGWELHLVGGCEAEDRSYVDDVERLAKDLPVTLHVGAASRELDALYAAARLYWHAAGLGDDPVAHPERLEHFGIAVVEAMSAGAVPIVFGAAGPRETVRDGIDGLHFHELDGLRRQTLRIIGDPELEMRLRASSLVRAERYRREHFVERIEGILDGVVNRRGRPEAGATR